MHNTDVVHAVRCYLLYAQSPNLRNTNVQTSTRLYIRTPMFGILTVMNVSQNNSTVLNVHQHIQPAHRQEAAALTGSSNTKTNRWVSSSLRLYRQSCSKLQRHKQWTPQSTVEHVNDPRNAKRGLCAEQDFARIRPRKCKIRGTAAWWRVVRF